MRIKDQEAPVSGKAHQGPAARPNARRPRIVPGPAARCFKGRRLYTEDDRKRRACPYPPEPEWVAALEEAAQRRERSGGT